ncbi:MULTISPECIES: DNA cytosine methyltransferase [unclassified Paraburkholderia]|uniref:DNA cytosine methyltransferase n=1 Tax=unclassified Paraburkholderia TaxID=2615204 RepID=UPI002AB65A38|nr:MULTISPECIES: DNA cytosine methyltransferase [unclassified Paraburkholderia]
MNQDIAEVLNSEAGRAAIREARPDVVVGGFPCQDHSVAKPLSLARGIERTQGKLWWSISELLWQRLEDGSPCRTSSSRTLTISFHFRRVAPDETSPWYCQHSAAWAMQQNGA